MYSIRRNVFETNSSSTHSLTMCNKTDYDKWLKGEIWLNRFTSYYREKYNCFTTFVDRNKALELYKIAVNENDFDFKEAETSGNLLSFIDAVFEDDLVSIDKYNEYAENFEEFEEMYTAENGETVIAFGYYGQDY